MSRCAKIGCSQRVDPRNGKYCSKEHAPYYHLEGGVDDYLSKSKLKKQENQKPKKPGIYERWQPSSEPQSTEAVIAKRIEKQSGLPKGERTKKREWLRDWRKRNKGAKKMDDRVMGKDIQRCDGFTGSAVVMGKAVLSFNSDGAIRVESLSELVGILPGVVRFVDSKTGEEYEITRVKKN